MRSKIACALLAAASLAGCATPYQKTGLTGGYNEVQLDTNVFRVSFQGNGYTGPDTVGDFLLLRSAEITLEHGFQFFQVAGSRDDTTSDGVQLPSTSTTKVGGNQAVTTYSGGGLLTVRKPASSQVIVCSVEKPTWFSYNA